MKLDDDVRRAYAELAIAVLGRDRDGAARLFGRLGFATRSGDHGALHTLAGLLLDALRDGVDLRAVDPAAQLAEAIATLSASPLARVPHHFVLLGRVLASLGGLVLTYPPRGGLVTRVAPRLARAAAGSRA
jgi:predicted unusual protein kinase regulating ubiquinone biosynthesis (AarF/ABC1/UbiB family)